LMASIGQNVLGGSRRLKKMMLQSLLKFCGEQVSRHTRSADSKRRDLFPVPRPVISSSDTHVTVTGIRLWHSSPPLSTTRGIRRVLVRSTKSCRCGKPRHYLGLRFTCQDAALAVRVPRRSGPDIKRRRGRAEVWLLCPRSSICRATDSRCHLRKSILLLCVVYCDDVSECRHIARRAVIQPSHVDRTQLTVPPHIASHPP